MESIDQAQAARVWQRVKGTGTLQEQSLSELIREEWEDAQVFWRLSRRMQGRESQMLRRLWEQERSHTIRLKGIRTMSGQEALQLQQSRAEGPAKELLRRCYDRMCRRYAAYEQRSREGNHGPVFAQLAREEQQNCCRLAELMGLLAGK